MDPSILRVNRAISIVPNDRDGLSVVNTITGNALRATTYIFAILETFARPASVDSAINTLKSVYSAPEDELRNQINILKDKKVLVVENHPALATHDRMYFGGYQHLSSQREMLMDSARTRAFSAAIDEVVGPDDIVMDVGSGSGILSFFAARQGAKKIYAIERSRMIELAREIAQENGLSEKIDFVQCMAEEFRCEENATVIISELLGDYVLRELSFKSFCSVRDRCAIADRKCIPKRVRMYIAPVEDSYVWQKVGPGYWTSSVYGFDYSPAFEVECAKLGSQRTVVPEDSLLDEPALVNDIDYEKTPVEDFYFDSQVEFDVRRNGSLHGFSGSFDMQLSPSVWLDTGSYAKETHWQQMFFPVTEALPVRRGDRIRLKMKVKDPENPHKRVPDTSLDVEIYRSSELIHKFASWYDKARGSVF